MGTGSFGGGSGSYGSGGSGSRGSGSRGSSSSSSASGSKGSTSGSTRSGGGGSVAQLIKSLLSLTRSFNKDPSVAGARRALSSALQDPGRREFFVGTLQSPFVQAVFQDLLTLARDNQATINWAAIAETYGLDPRVATLSGLVRALIRRHQDRSTDERHLEVVRNALSDIFLNAIGNDSVLYVRTAPTALAARFDTTVLPSISGYFLAALIRRAVRVDLGELKPEVELSMGTASREIADGWYERFELNYLKGARKRDDLLSVIAENYGEFAGLQQPDKVTK